MRFFQALGHHVLVKNVSKTRLLLGIAHLMAETSQISKFVNVQERAVGTFVIDISHDEANQDQTFLVGAEHTDKIEVARTAPAVIVVTQAKARTIR